MDGNDIIKRYESLKGRAHGNWKNLWQECADWSLPTHDNVNRIRVEGQEKPTQRMIDTCVEALFNFASGFFSHMFPPNTVWAKYRHPSKEMMDDKGVAEWFENVSRAAHHFLISSNFAQEEFQALLAMGCFGTNCVSVEEDEEEMIRFRNYMVKDVVLDENYRGEVDTVGREIRLTPRQAIQQFGDDALRKADLDCILKDAESGKDTHYKFVHLVSPRSDYNKGAKDKLNKPYASYYVSQQTKRVVRESGFDYNPYVAARFVTGNDEVYGRGPMSMVLGTARRTNVIYRSMIVSAEQNSNPQWLIPDDDSVKGLSGRAGAMIKWRSTNPNGKPERLDMNGDTGVAVDMYEMHDAQIKRMFFNHLFRPLEDYRNMTATEVNERMTTDLMTLAPFVSRYIDEHVSPIMEQVFHILQKKKMVPPMPAKLLEDPEFEIDYVGRLALATKNFETLGAINTIRIFAELQQGAPQLAGAMDNVEPNDLFRDVWYANSSSMNALRETKEVDEIHAQREQQMQQQQAVDNLAPVADAAQKLSGAVDPTSLVASMKED